MTMYPKKTRVVLDNIILLSGAKSFD